MSLSLQASADGNTVDLLLGSTVIASFSANGVESGVLIASDAEAQGFTNAKKLLSPEKLAAAFLGSNRSIGSNGYQRLPGGLILQWMTVSVTTTDTAFSFPISFPNSIFHSIAVFRNTASNATATAEVVYVKGQSSSNVTLQCSVGARSVTVFSIGY